jgi:hypothetical protein
MARRTLALQTMYPTSRRRLFRVLLGGSLALSAATIVGCAELRNQPWRPPPGRRSGNRGSSDGGGRGGGGGGGGGGPGR